MNFFKKLQHLSLLNCTSNSVLDFEQQLVNALSSLSPTSRDRICDLVSELNQKETGVFYSNYELWEQVTRSNVEVNQLSFDYFNGYAFRLATSLKKHQVKINKSKILHIIAKIIGLTGSQALKQRQLIELEFIRVTFAQDQQQDIIEVITCNDVIVDVQVSGFDAFCGCNAKVDNDTLMLYTPKKNKYVLPDASLSVIDSFDRGSFKYRVVSVSDVDSDYVLGFMAVVDGGVDNVDRERYEDGRHIQYKYGVNVALSNLKKITPIDSQ